MSAVEIVWQVNIPELLGLAQGGLDDMDVDAEGNVYIGDGMNGAVYKFRSTGELASSFDVVTSAPFEGEEAGLNLAVAPNSCLYVADPGNGVVVRYDAAGQKTGEFPAPGILELCCGPADALCILSVEGGTERIDCYNSAGGFIEALPAPARRRARLDPELVNLEADPEGRIYVSYGMPPYRIWRVSPGSEGIEAWGRDVEHPEDAVLIADIAFEPTTSVLWVLLAGRKSGRQMLDTFSADGKYLDSIAVPFKENLYTAVCAAGDGTLYLLEGGTGPGSGDLVRIRPIGA